MVTCCAAPGLSVCPQSANPHACTRHLPALARPPPCLPAELSPGGNKTFFDIGCNKGYTSAHYFGLWAPELGFSPTAMVAKHPELDCGFCEDCMDKVGELAC